MFKQTTLDVINDNLTNYESLLVSIEASKGIFNFLVAVFDDVYLRNRIIEKYESELKPRLIPYNIVLSSNQLNLKSEIDQLIKKDIYLQHGVKAIFTVITAEELSALARINGQSEEDLFINHLRWKQNELKKIFHPIVLWVTEPTFLKLMNPRSILSFRKQVFWFLSGNRFVIEATVEEAQKISSELTIQQIEETYSGQWVVIEVTRLEKGFPIAGKVIVHSEDICYIADKASSLKGDLYTFYCNGIDATTDF